MSMERARDEILWTCDNCGEIIDTDTDDFDQARDVMRSKGWKTKKGPKGWLHYCEVCK